ATGRVLFRFRHSWVAMQSARIQLPKQLLQRIGHANRRSPSFRPLPREPAPGRDARPSSLPRRAEVAMNSLAEQLGAYAAYHRDWRNKLTHFVGVPLVTFALFLFLGWLRFAPAPEVPFTGATLFYLVVCLYYLWLDWRVALLQAPFSLALLVMADWVAVWPFGASLAVFAGAFLS